jgi:hypothetical protein
LPSLAGLPLLFLLLSCATAWRSMPEHARLPPEQSARTLASLPDHDLSLARPTPWLRLHALLNPAAPVSLLRRIVASHGTKPQPANPPGSAVPTARSDEKQTPSSARREGSQGARHAHTGLFTRSTSADPAFDER